MKTIVTFPPSPATPFIKICGLTRVEDARLALELGAQFLGVILTAKSPRRAPEAAAAAIVELARSHPSSPLVFGVFVDEAPAELELLRHRIGFDLFQIHGPSQPPTAVLGAHLVIPALAIADADSVAGTAALPADHPALLADSFAPGQHGGTGKVFDHRHVQPLLPHRRIFIAGGLRPANIASVVDALGAGPLPYAFDLSSGIESAPGLKDHDLMRAFFANYREAMARRG